MNFIDNFFHTKFSSVKLNTRRGISDIIVTLLLITITIITGVAIFSFFQSPDFGTEISSETTRAFEFEGDLKLVGYDTRDGDDLSGLTAIDNDGLGRLTVGTDYIVLKFVNSSPDSLFIERINVNEIVHSWEENFLDDQTITPATGTFNIIEGANTAGTANVQISNEILSGLTVRTVLALSGDISSNINLNKAIRIQVDVIGFELEDIIVKAGSAK